MIDLLTEDQTAQLLLNGSPEGEEDPLPVAKLIARKAGYAWLLCALDPDEPSVAFTLCQFDNGSPRYDHIDLNELPALEMDISELVEIDPSFHPQHPISVYRFAAETHKKIVEDADTLATAAVELRDVQIKLARKALSHHLGGICQPPPRGYELIAPPLPKGLLTKRQTERLLLNGSDNKASQDHRPLVRLFLPVARCTWLLTELDQKHPTIAFGLVDDSKGHPALSRFNLAYVAEFASTLMWPLTRDAAFKATHPISVYALAAGKAGRYTDSVDLLAEAATELCQQREQLAAQSLESGPVPC